MSVPHGILYPNQQKSDIVVGFLSLPPDFKAVQGRQFCLSSDRGVWAGEVEGKYWGSPTGEPYLSSTWSAFCMKKAYSAMV